MFWKWTVLTLTPHVLLTPTLSRKCATVEKKHMLLNESASSWNFSYLLLTSLMLCFFVHEMGIPCRIIVGIKWDHRYKAPSIVFWPKVNVQQYKAIMMTSRMIVVKSLKLLAFSQSVKFNDKIRKSPVFPCKSFFQALGICHIEFNFFCCCSKD